MMKYEAGTLNLVMKPENEKDVFDLGVISKNFKYMMNMEKSDSYLNVESFMIDYKDLLKFLIEAKVA